MIHERVYIKDGNYVVERNGTVISSVPATQEQLATPVDNTDPVIVAPYIDLVELAERLSAVSESVDYLLLNELLGDF